MSKLTVYDMKGAVKGEVEVPDDILVLDKGQMAVHEAVVGHQAACRAGTASTLQKGEVAGSGKKPWRQKGTGRARAGYRRSPVWRGGGVVFGPKPRDFSLHTSRRTRKLAFKRALSERITAGAIRVVEDLELPESKTRLLTQLLKALGVAGPSLIVIGKKDDKLVLAARNLPDVEVALADTVSAYQILRYPAIVVSSSAMSCLETRLADSKESRK